MTSSTVWDLTESAVALIGFLPMIIQTVAVLTIARTLISNASNLMNFGLNIMALFGKSVLSGLNPFS